MDLPFKSRLLWITDSVCILASLLWHMLWKVLSIRRDKKASEQRHAQVTKNQKANQKKTLYLSCKGTASLKQEPPDSERSVQRTQLCTQKEKVQKLNKENTEKTTVILVESISTESQAEEISNLKRCISIDIPISRNRTPIEGDAPIIFSEESDRQSTPINADNFQSSTGVSNEDEGTEECFSKTHQCTEEKELSISVSEDEETVNNEDGKEDKKDDNENDEGQDEKESTENETSKEETEPLVVTEEDSELSENEGQAISASDKPQEKTQVPKTVGDISTECTDSSHSDTENTVLKLAKEDNEVSVDLIQNGENGYHEHSCSSKRVADEDQVKDDNKKSRVDTQATGQIISAKSAEETIVCLVISTEEPQTSDSTQDCTEQPSLKEETRFVLDSAPPPPAPFDHRIVSAKHAQINSFYSVENTEVLGTGRFGQVHSCVEKSSGLRLAAKVIKVRGHKEKEEVKNEIQVMNQLNHTNLIQLYDAFESRNDIVLVMEFVEGGELFDRIIDENCNLSEVDTILYIKQICEGIQYMHQMYIIHLDLKPENIMCVSRAANQIKIIDFGLARRYKPREKLKVHFGTPEFLAPEVVNYDFVSFPTDMWSVGVIAYMLLSGLSPFLGEDDNETLNNILACQWDFEGEEFNNISEDAKDFIIKLLVKEKCWRMSATESLKHSWLSDPKLHFKISQKVETDSLPEATVGE
ncbi:myosin light chain kinase family member 4 isoform 2-T2 [Discoglossus pictus]